MPAGARWPIATSPAGSWPCTAATSRRTEFLTPSPSPTAGGAVGRACADGGGAVGRACVPTAGGAVGRSGPGCAGGVSLRSRAVCAAVSTDERRGGQRVLHHVNQRVTWDVPADSRHVEE